MQSFRSLLLTVLASASLAVGLRAAPETYVIDPAHSSIGFTIRHFVSRVPGSLSDLSGKVVYDSANPEKSSTEAEIRIKSINTDNTKRDDHLRSPDYFDEGKFPVAAFKSTSWTKTGADTYDIAGDLTIRGVTKPVVLKAHLLGTGEGFQGAKLIGWEATTTVKKSDFGITAGAPALGDEVNLTINIEAKLQK
ncbi:YceI family protein [Nibricoccus sp. IMCC34717]|uniref:YceI family protein n=1 Tax=Nibricoccus sp. IMCC34717 TaxID=3034021 RepID=UPI00384FB227